MVYVYDPHTNLLLWEHDFGNQGKGESIFIRDLDDDGLPELLVALDQRIITYTYNDTDSSFNQARELEFTNLMDVKVTDLNGDGLEEIAVMHGAYLDYTLSIYDNSLAYIASNHISHLFTSMHIEDFPGENKNILLATVESSIAGFGSLEIHRLRALDPYTSAVIWSSLNLLGSVPEDSLSYTDIDGDAAKEMYFTTDKSINVIYRSIKGLSFRIRMQIQSDETKQ
ncbi:MAG: VCBS repeat-containing protein [Candidatus Thiodiazotropha sp.]